VLLRRRSSAIGRLLICCVAFRLPVRRVASTSSSDNNCLTSRAVLCCVVLCCAALRCAALRCAALCCAVLCGAVLCRAHRNKRKFTYVEQCCGNNNDHVGRFQYPLASALQVISVITLATWLGRRNDLLNPILISPDPHLARHF